MSVCLSVCLSVYPPLCLPICLFLALLTCLLPARVSLCPCAFQPVRLISLRLPVYLFGSLSACLCLPVSRLPTTCLPACPAACLSNARLPVWLPTCPLACLSICPSVCRSASAPARLLMLSVYLPVCLFVYQSVCLAILSVCPACLLPYCLLCLSVCLPQCTVVDTEDNGQPRLQSSAKTDEHKKS